MTATKDHNTLSKASSIDLRVDSIRGVHRKTTSLTPLKLRTGWNGGHG
jgi:hypothetical protein